MEFAPFYDSDSGTESNWGEPPLMNACSDYDTDSEDPNDEMVVALPGYDHNNNLQINDLNNVANRNNNNNDNSSSSRSPVVYPVASSHGTSSGKKIPPEVSRNDVSIKKDGSVLKDAHKDAGSVKGRRDGRDGPDDGVASDEEKQHDAFELDSDSGQGTDTSEPEASRKHALPVYRNPSESDTDEYDASDDEKLESKEEVKEETKTRADKEVFLEYVPSIVNMSEMTYKIRKRGKYRVYPVIHKDSIYEYATIVPGKKSLTKTRYMRGLQDTPCLMSVKRLGHKCSYVTWKQCPKERPLVSSKVTPTK